MRRMHHQTARKVHALLFCVPWLLGFLLFFLIPIISTTIYSFNIVTPGASGGRKLEFIGFKNYYDLFRTLLASDFYTTFPKMFYTEFINIITNTPLIIIFSLFAAMLLNMNYKGRGFVRVIFFLPIVVGLNLVVELMQTSVVMDFIDQRARDSSFLQATLLQNLLINSGLPDNFMHFIAQAVTKVFEIMSRSGVQILIFLAGLQSINKSLYEVAAIEGASKYNEFWKITLPMVSPLTVFVAIYTIVDMFLISKLTYEIYSLSFLKANIGAGSALSVCYLLFVLAIVGVVWGLLSKVVYKND